MKALTAILIITLVVSVNANPFSAYFNNIVDTILGRNTEKAKDEIQLAKEHALKAWGEAGAAIEDLSSATWDKLYEGYEVAWASLQKSRQKIIDKAKKSLIEFEKDWTIAKNDVKEAAKKVVEFLTQYKDKIEEKTSDTYFSTLETVESAAKAARTKFGAARDKISTLYDEVHDEAIDDYNTATKNLHDATERAKKFAEKNADKNFEATKKKLEEARSKAKDYYSISKKNLNDAKEKSETFNEEIKAHIKDYADFAKSRATDALEALDTYKKDAKNKAKKEYQRVLFNLQKANERAIEGAKEAELNAAYLEKRLARKVANVLEDAKIKYQSLKDEL